MEHGVNFANFFVFVFFFDGDVAFVAQLLQAHQPRHSDPFPPPAPSVINTAHLLPVHPVDGAQIQLVFGSLLFTPCS